jgi:hypothetical protein
VELLLNDLSIHGQFHDVAEFQKSVSRIVDMRRAAQRFGRDLHCHRNTVNRPINPSASVFEALQTFTRDQKRALLTWLTQRGPFWEDTLVHDPNEWLELEDDIVTDTAVGEAAYCSTTGIDRRLVSLTSSTWEYSPIPVTMLGDTRTVITVNNYWTVPELENALREADPPITSWSQLERVPIFRYQRLKFSGDAFEPLRGLPFSHTAAEYIKSRLHTLNDVMGCRDESGNFTPEARPILDAHLTRGSTQFSDSSTEEKGDFRDELTFPHPDITGETLDCTWHGKIKPLLIRLHFRWPVPPGEDLYVVYIGRKITADN